MTKKTEIELLVDEEFKKHGITSDNEDTSTCYKRTVTEEQDETVTTQGVKLRYGSKSIKVVGNKPSKKYITVFEKKEREQFGSISPPKDHPCYPVEVFIFIRDIKQNIENLWQYIFKGKYLKLSKTNSVDIGQFYFFCKEWAEKSQDSQLNENLFNTYREYLFNPLDKVGDQKEVIDEQHIKRDFVGKLLQVLISENFPDIFPKDRLDSQPPHGYAAKKLAELYNQIQKT